jgi:hypothetical protein
VIFSIFGYNLKTMSNIRKSNFKAYHQDQGLLLPPYLGDLVPANHFRSVYFRDCIEDIFMDVLDLLHQEGYIKFEEYFVDGTMIEADANRYSHVWLKNKARYKEAVKDCVRSLLLEIEVINKTEDDRYGNQDLEEMGANRSPKQMKM